MNQPLGLTNLATLAFAKHPGVSGSELARMAQEAGYELTATTLNSIRSGTYSYKPRKETVSALAWLTNIDEETAFSTVFAERPKSPEVTDFRSLIDLAQHKRRMSGRQLAFLAQEQGFKITTTTINHLKAGTYKSVPSAETIRAIGWLAGVADEVAFTAAGQPVPGPPLAEELPPGVDNLSPKSRKIMIEMARVLVDLEKNADASSTDAQEQPADIRDAGERRDARAGQKTKRGLSAVPSNPDAPVDGNIPLPENWQELAAYSGPTGHKDRESEWAKRGEESQDSDDES
ncbi:hypothetical protein [Paenarthrobacter nitroguajacolicus]|uniref:hypothetical protein n=1 Tax=Paenarthrobacter nitroguajacolicus TaxID=211146 RepID=UPI0015BD2F63|nr:hypothetical protein [Paenarthrobacter nitroguajacolicus]NWL32946.1 hypothetical protein [Paenarthrobacter nitroguajacolicus]